MFKAWEKTLISECLPEKAVGAYDEILCWSPKCFSVTSNQYTSSRWISYQWADKGSSNPLSCTSVSWMGAGQMIPLDLSKHWSCFLQTSLNFNLLRRMTPEMFMGTGFTYRDEHQERENPTQHSIVQPLTQRSNPCFSSSGQPNMGHPHPCLQGMDGTVWVGIGASLQMLGMQEGLQVKLQAGSSAWDLKLNKHPLPAQARPSALGKLSVVLPLSFRASEPQHHWGAIASRS